MIKEFKVVTLCGSTKFKKEFIEVQEKLTLEGYLVISVGIFGHADNKYKTVLTPEKKIMLDKQHKAKIDLADIVFIINKDGYIGESTANEIEYSMDEGKTIMYLE